MVADSFSSISVSDRETPMGVDSESLTTQYVELSSDPAMTEGTEQEDEGMETTIEVVGPALKVAVGSREHPESSQAAMEPGVQVLEVDLVTPAEWDELMKNLTGIQQLDASAAIDPAFQCRAGQQLLRQSREVAARPLQGGNASLDGAMTDSSGSEMGDPETRQTWKELRTVNYHLAPNKGVNVWTLVQRMVKTLKEMRIVSQNRKAGNRNPAWTRKATTLLSPGWVEVRAKRLTAQLRAAEQELQGLKALLEERGRYAALQSE